MRSLGLLLEGWACHGKVVQPVHRLLTKPPLQAEAGYAPSSHSFPLQQLLSCLQRRLSLNPFGITACLHSGKKLAWAQQGVCVCVLVLSLPVCYACVTACVCVLQWRGP